MKNNSTKTKSIGINAALNGIKTIYSLVFPLITFPYVSRVLQVENVGRYNFANSVINYFVLIAGLGVSVYAIREGAAYRNDLQKISKFSSEVFSINVISTLISYLFLLAVVLFVPRIRCEYILIVILSSRIIFTTIGCEWIFSIFEDYKFITVRGIVFQLLYAAALFIFVKSQDDLIVYTFVTLISSSALNFANVFFLHRYCRIRFTINIDWRRHLLPILVIFANSLTTTVYTSSDMTVLGFLSTDYRLGLYSVSVGIYNMVKQLLAAIIIVSIPRMSMLWGQKKKKEFEALANTIFAALVTIMLPAVLGIFLLSDDIVLALSCSSYAEAESSLRILSFALFFSIFSWFFTSCILIPCKDEKKVLTATIIAASLNLILNIVLIPYYAENAAAFTTVLSEAVSMLICCICARKYIHVTYRVRDIVSSLLGCILIVIVYYVFRNIDIIIVKLILVIVCSALVYAVTCLICRNSCIEYIRDILLRKKMG